VLHFYDFHVKKRLLIRKAVLNPRESAGIAAWHINCFSRAGPVPISWMKGISMRSLALSCFVFCLSFAVATFADEPAAKTKIYIAGNADGMKITGAANDLKDEMVIVCEQCVLSSKDGHALWQCSGVESIDFKTIQVRSADVATICNGVVNLQAKDGQKIKMLDKTEGRGQSAVEGDSISINMRGGQWLWKAGPR
jgi:hypothetical protein